MATVRVTLGNRANDNVNISSVTGTGPWTVTLSGAPPASTVIGDKLSDEAASPKVFLITGISGADLTVRDAFAEPGSPSAAGDSQAFTARCYADLNAWNVVADSEPLYGVGDIAEVAVCEEITISAPQNITGGGTLPLSKIVILGHENYRHSGTVISTGRISITTGTNAPAIYRWTTIPTIVEWLICSKLPTTGTFHSGFIIANASAGGYLDVANCLVFSNLYAAADGEPHGISQTSNSGTMHIQNCAVWGVRNPTTALGRAISLIDTAAGSTCDNCTVYGSQTGVLTNGTTALVRNIIAMGSAGNDFEGALSASSSNNCSEDATAPGANSLINQVVADTLVDAPAGNLHLKPTANAVGAGIDLSAQGGTITV